VLGGDEGPATEVRSEDPERLAGVLEQRGYSVQRDGDALLVIGARPEEVGRIAAQEHVTVLGLGARMRSLEAAFMALTGDQT
jgi:ABC-2 type transport system ATP-binding protein